MTTTLAPINTKLNSAASKRQEAGRVLADIQALCESIGSGGRLPRHTELMHSLQTSERNVLRSLEELQRQGRIVRRHGSGTFVTGRSFPTEPATGAPQFGFSPQTVVAIATPDRSLFDKGMELLYEQAREQKLELACHFIDAERVANVDTDLFGKPHGFVIFRRTLLGLALSLQAKGHRVVVVGSPDEGESFKVATVCNKHDLGGYLIIRHLVELGHTRIALADRSNGLLQNRRHAGHLKMKHEVERSGGSLSFDVLDGATLKAWIQNSDLVKEYFGKANSPTAIAFWNDRDALDLMGTFSRAGIRVPEDLSVVGYDNLEAGLRHHPSLTTIDHSFEEQVSAALEMLVSADGPDPGSTLIFAPTLLARESTAKPRKPSSVQLPLADY